MKKPDLSRLVVLGNVTPTEAVILSAMLALVNRSIGMACREGTIEIDDQPLALSAMRLGDELSERIRLQLDVLLWPSEKRKAPFPL